MLLQLRCQLNSWKHIAWPFYLPLCISQLQLHPDPPPPRPRRPDPRALAFFLHWMANSWGWRLLHCKITWGVDEKRGQMPRPLSTRQHSSLIEQ